MYKPKIPKNGYMKMLTFKQIALGFHPKIGVHSYRGVCLSPICILTVFSSPF